MEWRRAKLDCAGKKLRPSEFEALGGRGMNKKWKQSIRVASLGIGGGEGPSVETWLERNGWSVATAAAATATGQSPRSAVAITQTQPTKVQPARPIKKPRRLLDGAHLLLTRF